VLLRDETLSSSFIAFWFFGVYPWQAVSCSVDHNGNCYETLYTTQISSRWHGGLGGAVHCIALALYQRKQHCPYIDHTLLHL
jgi:dipeptide/tripeptide permease